MAAKRKPKVKKLRFELTRSAIGGIAVVVFCLFLWMFLLGIWVGQTLLLPSYKDITGAAMHGGPNGAAMTTGGKSPSRDTP